MMLAWTLHSLIRTSRATMPRPHYLSILTLSICLPIGCSRPYVWYLRLREIVTVQWEAKMAQQYSVLSARCARPNRASLKPFEVYGKLGQSVSFEPHRTLTVPTAINATTWTSHQQSIGRRILGM